jgi:hypothetical protein
MKKPVLQMCSTSTGSLPEATHEAAASVEERLERLEAMLRAQQEEISRLYRAIRASSLPAGFGLP